MHAMTQINENAQKLVKALRSGNYKQTSGQLRRDVRVETDEGVQDESRFCCLGVACDIYLRDTGQGEWLDRGGDYLPTFRTEDKLEAGVLPDPVRIWLGFATRSGIFGSDNESLTDLNDQGKTFSEIADVIESAPIKLFS